MTDTKAKHGKEGTRGQDQNGASAYSIDLKTLWKYKNKPILNSCEKLRTASKIHRTIKKEINNKKRQTIV